MSRTRQTVSTAPTVPVRMRVLSTDTGYPAPLDVITDMWHGYAHAAEQPGWWWSFATPRSHASMMRHGHLAVGTVTTSFCPPEHPRPGEYVDAFAHNARACATCGGTYPCLGHPGPERPAGGPRGMGPSCGGDDDTCTCVVPLPEALRQERALR